MFRSYDVVLPRLGCEWLCFGISITYLVVTWFVEKLRACFANMCSNFLPTQLTKTKTKTHNDVVGDTWEAAIVKQFTRKNAYGYNNRKRQWRRIYTLHTQLINTSPLSHMSPKTYIQACRSFKMYLVKLSTYNFAL